jgi:uncharacterized protein involved in type VI secretion and phage assembly
MPLAGLFEAASTGLLPHIYTGAVTAIDDPDGLRRVKIRLHQFDGSDTQNAEMWARVAVPFAGDKRGAFFIPDVDDEVVVAFLAGDPRYPVVVGSLWNGGAKPPDEIPGDRVDRWSIVGKDGSRIAIVESGSGQATITLKTANGVSLELTDQGGGKIEMKTAVSTVTIDSSGISVKTTNTKLQAATVTVDAPKVDINSAIATVKSMLKVDVLKATTVLSNTYQPGIGNIW